MLSQNRIKKIHKFTKDIRQFWTEKWEERGKAKRSTWREPFNTMYDHITSQRALVEKFNEEGLVDPQQYIWLIEACEKMQLELYLFLVDDREINLMSSQYDSLQKHSH